MSAFEKLPEIMKNAVNELPEKTKALFVADFEAKSKSIGLGYLSLWACVHYFYFRKPGLGIAYIVSLVLWVGILWLLADLFRVPGMVREHNEGVARELLAVA